MPKRPMCYYCNGMPVAHYQSDDMYLCSKHYTMYWHNDPRLEWEALVMLVNQSVSEATPPPTPTAYPSGNPPAPPCADTVPEMHRGNGAYDASSDH